MCVFSSDMIGAAAYTVPCHASRPSRNGVAFPAAAATPAPPHKAPAITVSVRAVQTAERGSRRSPDFGVRMNTPSLRNRP